MIFFKYEKWVSTAGVFIMERMVVFVGPRAPAPFTHTQIKEGQFILPLGLVNHF